MAVAAQSVFWSLEVKCWEASLSSASSSRMTRMPSLSPFMNNTVTIKASTNTKAQTAEKCLLVDIGHLL